MENQNKEEIFFYREGNSLPVNRHLLKTSLDNNNNSNLNNINEFNFPSQSIAISAPQDLKQTKSITSKDQTSLGSYNNVIPSFPFLQITILNSKTLPNGLKIYITQNGLFKSTKQPTSDNNTKNNTITYFGFNEDKNETPSTSVDFYLPPLPNAPPEEKFIGKYFQITYNDIMKKYLLKDLGIGLGTFIKIKESFLLKDNSLINIGDSFIVVNFESENDKQQHDENVALTTIESKFQGVGKKVSLKIFEEDPETHQHCTNMFTFEPNENKRVTIGRKNHGNDVELNDTLISKTNSTMEYVEQEGWLIKDGKYDGNTNEMKPSTNGTWVLAVEDYPITEGLIFKGHFNLFCCNFITN